jgi:hypothetical protein
MKKLRDASGWLLIILVMLVAGCNGTDDFAGSGGQTGTCGIQYAIPNNDRKEFGGSPAVWAAGVEFTDSNNVSHYWLLTEADIEMLNERAANNLTDRP